MSDGRGACERTSVAPIATTPTTAATEAAHLADTDRPDATIGHLMRITDAKVIVCCPGRNFVTLKIETEDGIYGLGDATLNGRELAVASYLRDHVVPLLIGRDARRIEDTWQYLYKGAYWRRGPVTMSAIARGRHRAVGHSRQGAQHARLSVASAARRASRC